MTFAADARVDAYIDALPAWQQDICRQVRDLVHAADPEAAETIKRTRQPYLVLQGNVCALLAAKDHVNVSRTCSRRSSPTTAPAAGGSSSASRRRSPPGG
jgi:hypothetical protein